MVRLSLVLLLCPAMAEADEVALRFAWPAKVEARVRYRRAQEKGGRAAEGSATWTMVATQRGEGTQIVASRTVWEPAIPAGVARAMEQVIYVLARDGKSVRLDGLEGVRSLLRARQPTAGPGAIEAADAAMSAEATELWSLLVGLWAGREMEVGKTYEGVGIGYAPTAPGEPIEQRMTMSVVGRVPCAVGQKKKRCVEVVYEAEANRDAVIQATRAALRGRGPVPGVDDLAGLGSATKAVLVTDPATLLPYRLEITKRHVSLGIEGGRLVKGAVRDQTEYRYEYKGSR